MHEQLLAVCRTTAEMRLVELLFQAGK